MRRTQIVPALIAALLLVCVAWAVSAQNAAPPSTPAAPPAAAKDKAATPDTGAPADVENPLPAVKADELPQMPELNEAQAKFRDRDFEGASKALEEAHKKNAELPPGPVILAQWFSQVNIPQGVRNALEQAVIKSPGDPEAYILMSDLALRERRFTESRLLLEKADLLMNSFAGSAKRRDVLKPRIPSGLAATAEYRADWQAAQKHLDAWLKLDPKNAEALRQLAFCLYQQKNTAGALEKLNEALKLDKEMLTPEAIISQWCEQASDRENARKQMRAAIIRAPSDLNTRIAATKWSFGIEDYEGAKTQANAALKLDSKSLDAKILAGVIHLFLKDYKAAEMYCASALEQSPKYFPASNNLALALCEQDDKAKKERALEYAEVNGRAYPKSSEAASTYGWVLYKLGKLDEAEKALRAATQSGQFSADTAYYAAVISHERGRGEDAKKLLELGLKSPGPFMNKDKAAALYKKINK